MFRVLLKTLVAAGLALAAAGGCWYHRVATPEPWTLEDAVPRIGSRQPRLVTLRGRPEPGAKRYNTAANDVTRERPTLGAVSPTLGTPLDGPGAAPPGEWAALVGRLVAAGGRLRVEAPDPVGGMLGARPRLREPHVMVPADLVPHERQRDQTPVRGRRILAAVGANVWALAPGGPAEAGSAGDGLYPWEADWAKEPVHRGVLRRLTDRPAAEAAFRAARAGSDPDGAWLIDESERPQFTQYAGYHAYYPVAGSDRAIWVQVPLEQDGGWAERAGDELTGVWLPAGSHAFAPDGPGGRPGGTAVLRWGEQARDRFVGDGAGPWRAVLFGGAGLVALPGLLLFLTAPVPAAGRPGPGRSGD